MANNVMYTSTPTTGSGAVVKEVLKTTKDVSDQTISVVKDNAARIEEATDKVLDSKMKAFQAGKEAFSNEQGKELNRMYGEYFGDSIKENFDTKVELMQTKLALMEEAAQLRLKIAEERAQADIEIRKKKADAEVEIEGMKRKAQQEVDKLQEKADKLSAQIGRNKFWRIAAPLLGIFCGVATFALMFLL